MSAANQEWTGTARSYIPQGDPRSSGVPFCDAEADDLDPVTFEVVRHALWNVNIEHGDAIIRVSGSPQAVFTQDFNPGLFTATGEYVFTGPYIQVHASVVDLVIRWILENRAENPGIRPGDAFLCNDPWIGAHHQQDVVLAMPVFWKGELLCWTANVLHQQDLGGSTPGGYCPDARDAFDEPDSMPPVKILEGGVMRRDIEELYLRRSRQPHLLALDLRAQLAGCNVTTKRLEGLAERYGPGVLRSSFEKIIGDAASAVGDRLESLPDGEWVSEAFIECREPGDRGVYRGQLTATKRGRELVLSDRGTDAQVGNINTTYSSWRSSILAALSPLMCFDLLYAIGGALRCVRFDPEPGTITCADFPAAVSNTSGGALMAFNLAASCLSKMLDFSDELRREIFAAGANTAWPLTLLGGVDERSGRDFVTVQLDAMGGGYGAFSWRDGTNTSGVVWAPMSPMPNVEFTEQLSPVLYLYRREAVDSGGAGRFRGGAAGEFALTPHGARDAWFATSTSGVGLPTAQGLAGGLPGASTRISLAVDDGLRGRLSAGDIPAAIAEVSEAVEPLAPKDPTIPLAEGAVVEVAWSGPGGFGDPLERDPRAVRRDVVDGYVSAASAEALYGVVVDGDGDDGAGTEALRAERRAARLREAAAPRRGRTTRPDGEWTVAHRSSTLRVLADGADRRYACDACEADLGPASDNYKEHCAELVVDPHDLGPFYPDQSIFIDESIALRHALCPGCARVLSAELVRVDDPPLHDVRLEPSA